jgi:hypothetical protein
VKNYKSVLQNLLVELQLLKLERQQKLNSKSASTASKMLFAMQRLQLKKASLPVVVLHYCKQQQQRLQS